MPEVVVATFAETKEDRFSKLPVIGKAVFFNARNIRVNGELIKLLIKDFIHKPLSRAIQDHVKI